MTTEEFSNEFDTQVSAFFLSHPFAKPQGFNEFNEYEKSVFLTKAQELTVVELYSGKNPVGDAFEKTEEIRRYLESLVKTWTTDDLQKSDGISRYYNYHIGLPEGLWFIVYESADFDSRQMGCKESIGISVYPVPHDEYHKVKNNPFRGPNERRVLRIDKGEGQIELVSKYEVTSYFMRYLSKPSPIILINLDSNYDGLSINGVTERTECGLHEALHRPILQRAVELALASRTVIAPPSPKEPADNK